MAPYGDRFLVHGGQLVGYEETAALRRHRDAGKLPDLTSAQERYKSPDYQAILPLRTKHSTSIVARVEGVLDGHPGAIDKISQLFPNRDAPSR